MVEARKPTEAQHTPIIKRFRVSAEKQPMPLNNALREVQEDAFDVFPVLIELFGCASRFVEVFVHNEFEIDRTALVSLR